MLFIFSNFYLYWRQWMWKWFINRSPMSPTHLPLRRMVIGAVLEWELLLVTCGWVILLLWPWRPEGTELGSDAAPWTELGLSTVFWISRNFNSLISIALEKRKYWSLNSIILVYRTSIKSRTSHKFYLFKNFYWILTCIFSQNVKI